MIARLANKESKKWKQCKLQDVRNSCTKELSSLCVTVPVGGVPKKLSVGEREGTELLDVLLKVGGVVAGEAVGTVEEVVLCVGEAVGTVEEVVLCVGEAVGTVEEVVLCVGEAVEIGRAHV